MKLYENFISSELLKYDVNEDIVIYKGRFCVYLDKKYKCSGKVYLKTIPPVSINFHADILFVEDIDDVDIGNMELNYDNAVLEVHGYKITSVSINSLGKSSIDGYLNGSYMRSKNSFVDYVDFGIINSNKYSGKLIKSEDTLYAGRMEFEFNDFVVVLDKREDYRKELYEELKSKSGSIITHVGRIYKKDNTSFKTSNIIDILDDISIALSFACGRYVGFCTALGYKDNSVVYKLWGESRISPFKFVPNWTDTISNHHNIEKYLGLICKKLEDFYFGKAIRNVVNWYIESLSSITLENNIISVQVALETLSYIVLVEQEKTITDEEFDKNVTSKNLRLLLDSCKIPYGKEELVFFDAWINDKFDDGVDLLIYYRNTIVHPSRKTKRARLELEDMWNIITIGTRYIELVLLYIIGYRGEYSNRLKDRSYGEVDVVPWSQ